MQKQFVTYEIALKLKELGFDEECLGCFYNGTFYIGNSASDTRIYNDCDAPLWQQVIDWFRINYNIIVSWNLHDPDNSNTWRITISHYDCYYLLYNQNVDKEPYYKTYEEAREAAILKAIELCQEISK